MTLVGHTHLPVNVALFELLLTRDSDGHNYGLSEIVLLFDNTDASQQILLMQVAKPRVTFTHGNQNSMILGMGEFKTIEHANELGQCQSQA
jgi:hypothetical protein